MMNAPFGQVFLALQERIAGTVTEIAYVDQDMGQLNGKGRPAVSWPCVLIEMEDFGYEDMGELVQTAKGTVLLKLGFAPQGPTGANTPAGYKEAALGHYELEWQLNKVLHGWSPAGAAFGTFTRTAVATQRRTDGYRVREMRYSLTFDDRSLLQETLYVPATMTVTI
jgi:hypothetical protein